MSKTSQILNHTSEGKFIQLLYSNKLRTYCLNYVGILHKAYSERVF